MSSEKLIDVHENIPTNVWNWIKNIFSQCGHRLRQAYPNQNAFSGAGLGILGFGMLIIFIYAVDLFLPVGWEYFLIMLVLFPVACGLAISLALSLIDLLNKLPEYFRWALFTGIMMAVVGFGKVFPSGIIISVLLAILAGLLGAGIWALVNGRIRQQSKVMKIFYLGSLSLGSIGILMAAFWLLTPGQAGKTPEPALISEKLPSLANTVSDPSQPGSFSVKSLTYGSGTDKRRPDFSEDVSILTDSVNGSSFVSNWTRLRTMIWGFDDSALPLNGRVWFPDGTGPFPLVLVVHGNHLAEDYSDAGYKYLCELLASRGTICVSVDQNFLNGSAAADFLGIKGLKNENDLRGWLLLEHLALWEDLSIDPTTPFINKVNMDQIALIGHSRGGEAVAIASAFNRLNHYPDDALVKFDYGFNIQSVIAIAPIDRQYQPASRSIPLTDVNYLTLQGSHDMDVKSFDGYNAYTRVKFTGEEFFFKSAVYVYGANHGQFNTVWGNDDVGIPPIWLYRRGDLITGEAQKQIAQVYISAFIDATLHNKIEYLPLFQNYQTGLTWLPETIYINAYDDSRTDYLLSFEDDIDVTSGSKPGVHINGHGLTTWREDRVGTKWGKMQQNSAVYLGWDSSDTTSYYTVKFDRELMDITEFDQLIISSAQLGQNLDDDGNATPIDYAIALIDSQGSKAVVPLSTISRLQPELEAVILKLGLLSSDLTSEIVFQTYLFDLDLFTKQNPGFALSDLNEIRLEFNLTNKGNIVVDRLGFRQGDLIFAD